LLVRPVVQVFVRKAVTITFVTFPSIFFRRIV
jgi:hypothetical protein